MLSLILHPKLYGWIRKKWRKLMYKNDIKFSEPVKGWKSYVNSYFMDRVLKKMLLSHENSKKEIGISNYWKELNNRNIFQLVKFGFKNFKQTVALNYFTNLADNDKEIEFLKKKLSPSIIVWAEEKAKTSQKHLLFTPEQSSFYNFVTFMLWEFTKQQECKNILNKLSEPLVGNPPAVYHDGKWISQDLAYSVLEYQSIKAGTENFHVVNTILEIGAGYGRTAYVILSLNPKIRYIIVDIPPALYISQKYLSKVFPDKKVFCFRDFNKFSEIEKDFLSSDIIFLMPHQLQKLPQKSVDLCLAIDCLHEMLPDQLDFYFRTFDMLGKSLYFKCWKKVTIPYDNVILTEKDYPVRSDWRKIFWRECKVQFYYFEAFFSWEQTR